MRRFVAALFVTAAATQAAHAYAVEQTDMLEPTPTETAGDTCNMPIRLSVLLSLGVPQGCAAV